jgi:hypothetical protein
MLLTRCLLSSMQPLYNPFRPIATIFRSKFLHRQAWMQAERSNDAHKRPSSVPIRFGTPRSGDADPIGNDNTPGWRIRRKRHRGGGWRDVNVVAGRAGFGETGIRWPGSSLKAHARGNAQSAQRSTFNVQDENTVIER